MFARCREVQASPDGRLDLWAREHWKSSVITFALTIQDVLNDPEITVGIFSHARPMAKKFLSQIKQEFEMNGALKELFPDVLWANPQKDAPRWSEDGGIIVRRQLVSKEATVEAWGLVDGQPTGAHFKLRVYDDVITREAVNTPEMIAKATEAWELSLNLGVADGGRERYIGTRYALMDTYHEIMQRGAAIPRIHPATDDGTETGKPVLFTPEQLKDRRRQGTVTFAAQMLQKPVSKATATFDIDHLRFAEIRPKTLNVYILCDPAHSKSRGSDRTAMAAIGVDANKNKYLLDGYNHRMNLKERWDALSGLRKKWLAAPGVQGVHVGYERYGLQADIEHFELEMERAKTSFVIEELAWPRDGKGAKGDRIGRLRPDHEQGHFFLPMLCYRDADMCFLKVEEGDVKYVKATRETSLMRKMADAGETWRILRPIKRLDEEQRLYDLSVRYIIEYLAHPAPGAMDDLLDAVSRIYDIDYKPPVIIKDAELEPEVFAA